MTPEPVVFAVGLGSNLGERRTNLRLGVRCIKAISDRLTVSSLYETRPEYVEDQPAFLNTCATGLTRLTARQLLSHLQDAERAAGRRRGPERYGPRTLDLDLLLYDERVVEEPDLVVPHPRLRERGFVLVPLAEIAAHWVVPASGGHVAETVATLAARAGSSGVERLEAGPFG